MNMKSFNFYKSYSELELNSIIVNNKCLGITHLRTCSI